MPPLPHPPEAPGAGRLGSALSQSRSALTSCTSRYPPTLCNLALLPRCPSDPIRCLRNLGRLAQLRSPNRECIKRASQVLPSFVQDQSFAATTVPSDLRTDCTRKPRAAKLRCPARMRSCSNSRGSSCRSCSSDACLKSSHLLHPSRRSGRTPSKFLTIIDNVRCARLPKLFASSALARLTIASAE